MVLIDGQIKGKASGLIDVYVYNLCKALGIGRMRSKLIQINFTTDQEGQLGNAWGCSKEGYAEINIARKCEGKPVKYAEMMQTLAHEMVHVKQYARRELHLDNTSDYTTYAEYADQWFEREAFELEEILLKKLKLFQNNG